MYKQYILFYVQLTIGHTGSVHAHQAQKVAAPDLVVADQFNPKQPK